MHMQTILFGILLQIQFKLNIKGLQVCKLLLTKQYPAIYKKTDLALIGKEHEIRLPFILIRRYVS